MSTHRRTLILALAFLGLTLVYFARPLFLGQAFTRGDIGAYFYPHRLFLARSVWSGEVPLWNPLVFCGIPYFADPLNSFFYPLNWLFVLCSRPGTVWLMLALHVSFAGLGATFLAREMMGTDWWASFCCGCVYAFSGYWCMHMGHFTQVMAGAWTPWVCWATVRWTREPARGRFCLLAMLLAVQLLPGGTENVSYLFFSLFLFAVGHATVRMARAARDGRDGSNEGGVLASVMPGLGILLAMGLATALAGVQVVPTLENLLFSFRWGGMELEYAGNQSIPPWKTLIEILIPNYGGHYGATPYTPTEIPHPETVGYVGPVATLLALLAAVKRWPRATIRVCIVLTLVNLFLAFGRFTPLYRVLYLLGLSMFRNPARAIYLVDLGLALLCGTGVQYLLEGGRLPLRRRSHRWAAFGTAGVSLLILGAVLRPGVFDLFERHTLPWLYAGDLAASLAALAFAYLALTIPTRKTQARLLLVAILLPLFIFLRESEFWNLPEEDPADTRSKTNAIEAVRGQLGPYRIYSRHFSAFKNQELVGHGLPEASGMYAGLYPLRRFWELQQRMTPDSHLAGTEGRRFLDLLGARLLLYDHAAPEGEGRSLIHHEPYRVYENEFARPRVSFVPRGIVLSDEDTLRTMAEGDWQPSETVLLDRMSPPQGDPRAPAREARAPRLPADRANTVACEVVAPTRGFLVLNDAYYPGWEAFVDGAPAELLRANYLFRAVALAPGAHLVEFRYRPQSLKAGAALSAASLLALLLVLTWKRRPGAEGEADPQTDSEAT